MHRYLEVIVWGVVPSLLAQNYALRFYGNGQNDIDRVKILIGTAGHPLNIGGDFTIEFKIRASLADNPQGSQVQDGAHDDWIYGHTLIDRDIFGAGDHGDYGISLAGGRIAFGVNNGSVSYTVVSQASIADDAWHDIAITRSSDGLIRIFIDGELDKAVSTAVTGDISYRAGRSTTWPNDPYLVLGAEKHDYDRMTYPSFRGLLDELRISSVVRYSGRYTPAPYHADDIHTVALYHFDEGQGTTILNAAARSGAAAHGTLHYGGSPAGPVWEAVSASTTLPSPSFSQPARAEPPLPVFDTRGVFWGWWSDSPPPLPKGIYLIGRRRLIIAD